MLTMARTSGGYDLGCAPVPASPAIACDCVRLRAIACGRKAPDTSFFKSLVTRLLAPVAHIPVLTCVSILSYLWQRTRCISRSSVLEFCFLLLRAC
jgi:hypothetical protein